MMDLTVKTINEMTTIEFLNIAKERIKVFVVEQNCPYQEVDDEDVLAYHVCLKKGEKPIAYTRIINHIEDVTFGRVLVVKDQRGKKLGETIVAKTIEVIKTKFPNKEIRISAQHYLVEFYQSFGFRAISEVYLEDNIPHIDMLLEND